MINASPIYSPEDDPEFKQLKLVRLMKPYDFATQGLSLDALVEDELAALREKKKLKAAQQDEFRRRAEMVVLCANNPEQQATEIALCREDPIYFIRNYCFTFDPREKEGEQYIPLIPFEFQEELIKWATDMVFDTIRGIGRRTGLVEKSRDMGVSWIFMCIAVWFWIFHGGAIHVGSRVYDEADKLGDPGSMLEKVRIILRRLPRWMLPDKFDITDERTYMKEGCIGVEGKGTITAEAASKNFGRSDRKTFIVIDELAFWEWAEEAMSSVSGGSTNCVFVISTPNGPFGMFARMANPEPGEPAVEKKTYHWMRHPIKRANARKGPDGFFTSHWKREASKPPMTPESVAAEIEILYNTSTKGVIFSEYGEDHQVEDWIPTKGNTIYRIHDPGIEWFVLWMEIDKFNRAIFFQESRNEDSFVDNVALNVKRISLTSRMRGFVFEDLGDPNGAIRQVASAMLSDFDVMEKDHQILIDSSLYDGVPSDVKVKSRIANIHNMLQKLCPKNKTPMMLVDKKNCPWLHKALLGGYRRKVDPKTKQVLDAIHNVHPYGDAIDCTGMGITHVFGMPGEYKNKRGPVTVSDDNVYEWSSSPGAKKRSFYGGA